MTIAIWIIAICEIIRTIQLTFEIIYRVYVGKALTDGNAYEINISEKGETKC